MTGRHAPSSRRTASRYWPFRVATRGIPGPTERLAASPCWWIDRSPSRFQLPGGRARGVGEHLFANGLENAVCRGPGVLFRGCRWRSVAAGDDDEEHDQAYE